VLIAASRGAEDSERALRVLDSYRRMPLTSIFVKLEAYPKAARFHPIQRAFLNEYFMSPSVEWAADLYAVVNLGMTEAERYGLGAMDSLHVAAAILLSADVLVTTEKPSQSIYRAAGSIGSST
jgi:hypothetical protein